MNFGHFHRWMDRQTDWKIDRCNTAYFIQFGIKRNFFCYLFEEILILHFDGRENIIWTIFYIEYSSFFYHVYPDIESTAIDFSKLFQTVWLLMLSEMWWMWGFFFTPPCLVLQSNYSNSNYQKLKVVILKSFFDLTTQLPFVKIPQDSSLCAPRKHTNLRGLITPLNNANGFHH